jgi:hypothetical protein
VLFCKSFPRARALGNRTPLFQSSKRLVLTFYEGINFIKNKKKPLLKTKKRGLDIAKVFVHSLPSLPRRIKLKEAWAKRPGFLFREERLSFSVEDVNINFPTQKERAK